MNVMTENKAASGAEKTRGPYMKTFTIDDDEQHHRVSGTVSY